MPHSLTPQAARDLHMMTNSNSIRSFFVSTKSMKILCLVSRYMGRIVAKKKCSPFFRSAVRIILIENFCWKIFEKISSYQQCRSECSSWNLRGRDPPKKWKYFSKSASYTRSTSSFMFVGRPTTSNNNNRVTTRNENTTTHGTAH